MDTITEEKKHSKICSLCKKEHSLTDFRIHRNNKDGLSYNCKWCDDARVREHIKKRPDLRRALHARRRSLKLNATPGWADHEKIKEIYKEAKILEDALETRMHVDHIVPLKGKLVCGLHVEYNLQVLDIHTNTSKGNRFNDE